MERKETLKKGADTMTTEKLRRINEAIIETEMLLEKELTYSEDLQDTKQVEFYHNHITKLQGMLK